VGSEIGLRSFLIAKRARASNALDGYTHSQMGGVAEAQTVVALGLDWLAANIPKPNVIKCDVEGAEGEVFGRAADFLKQNRPVVICEVSKGKQTIADVFAAADYVLYNGEKPLAGSSPTLNPTWTTIGIPRESQSVYCSLGANVRLGR
jgi:hypothetical protein